MSLLSDPRLAAPSHGRAGKHISSFNLLVAGVKGPLYLRGEKQMNPGLKQGTCFFFFSSPTRRSPSGSRALYYVF